MKIKHRCDYIELGFISRDFVFEKSTNAAHWKKPRAAEVLDSGAGAHVSLEVLDNGVEIRCDMIIGMNNERMELNNNNTTTHLSQNTVNEIE